MILEEVTSEVSNQLSQQRRIEITTVDVVPEVGPANRGRWFQIPGVSAVFADLKNSTELNANHGPKVAAYAYTHFDRAMTVIFRQFFAKYIEVQGDGAFGLFSGKGSRYNAAACAVTMRTLVEREVAPLFQDDTQSGWNLTAGIGIDHGTLLVRRLGLRGTELNEVWAGNPVNMAAKLSSQAGPNQVMVSERVFNQYKGASKLRRRALLWSCGCHDGIEGGGLDVPEGETSRLWEQIAAPDNIGLDFESMHRLKSAWCKTHGPQFCEAIITGQRP